MALSDERFEGLNERFRRVVIRRVRKATRDLIEATEADRDESVHETRKSIKRARSIARLSRYALGKKRFRAVDERFQDAGRRISPLRDAAILIDTLDQFIKRYGTANHDESIQALRRFLVDEKAATMNEGIDDGTFAEVMSILGKAIRSMSRLRMRLDRESIERGLREIERRSRRAFRDVLDSPSDERLHTWRKRIKDLRNALEFLAGDESASGRGSRRLKEVQELAETLGEDHDLALLRIAASERFAGSNRDSSIEEVVGWIDQRRGELYKRLIDSGRRIDRKKIDKVASE